jgi:hypothetical protein
VRVGVCTGVGVCGCGCGCGSVVSVEGLQYHILGLSSDARKHQDTAKQKRGGGGGHGHSVRQAALLIE